MKIFKKKEIRINWLQLLIAFILGILIACNCFLLWNMISLQKEIQKLKADDLAIAQAINNILSQSQKGVPIVPSQSPSTNNQ